MRGVLLTALWASLALIKCGIVQAASIYDCWDPEKLSRMNFPLTNQEANDPQLGKFSKLLKCLMMEQSKQPGGLNAVDWSQWQNGQLPQGWNNGQQQWTRPGYNNNPNNWPPNTGVVPQPGQPRPGVHPDDWEGSRNMPPPNQPQPGVPGNWPPPNQPQPGGQGAWPPRNNLPPPPGPPPPNPPPWATNTLDDDDDEAMMDSKRRKNRRKNKNNLNNNEAEVEQRPQIPSMMPPDASMAPGMNPVVDPFGVAGVPAGNQWGTSMGAVNNEESKEVIRNRQYGYAIMACAVVVLAVLMVSAIFCCNSSNSTMSQAATTVAVQPPDTFSIYSYNNKQPMIGSDTLRSIPLGDNLRTETMRSTASPQYRVSDIDPDFARRFREEHY